MRLIPDHQKNIKYVLLLLFGCFFLWDLYASLDFYIHTQLAGDVAAVSFPIPEYQQVLDSPLGLHALMTGESYAGTNRFWAHFITYTYFNNVPILLQKMGVQPIDSLYLACGLLKILTQIGIILLLSKWVLGNKSIFSVPALMLATFIGAFFLTANTDHRAFNIRSSMTIIDNSILYTIFYATSLLAFMAYLHPFLQRIWGLKENTFSIRQHLLLFFLSFVVSFNGSINSPVILLIIPLLLLTLWLKNFKTIEAPFFSRVLTAVKNIPRGMLYHLIWVTSLNFYAFYIGTFNLENPIDPPTLLERYSLLWQGFYHQYICNNFHLSPLLVLFILTLINTGLILKFIQRATRARYCYTFVFILVFFTAYTLLLPLGGYRAYRPFIIRYDVMIPTTLGLLLVFFQSCYLLASELEGMRQVVYAIPLMSLLVFLSIVDRIPTAPSNTCEYNALKQFASSKEKIVALLPCPILSWHLFKSTTGSDSETVSKLLYRWNIIDEEEKRYYNVSPQ